MSIQNTCLYKVVENRDSIEIGDDDSDPIAYENLIGKDEIYKLQCTCKYYYVNTESLKKWFNDKKEKKCLTCQTVIEDGVIPYRETGPSVEGKRPYQSIQYKMSLKSPTLHWIVSSCFFRLFAISCNLLHYLIYKVIDTVAEVFALIKSERFPIIILSGLAGFITPPVTVIAILISIADRGVILTVVKLIFKKFAALIRPVHTPESIWNNNLAEYTINQTVPI